MSTFQIKLQDNSLIDVPDGATFDLQGLRIIGDNVYDWNEPYMQNLMVLMNKILVLIDRVSVLEDSLTQISEAL